MAAVRNARVKSLLTSREREVFELLVQDKTTRDIAETLFISEKTVRNHISNAVWPVVCADSAPLDRKPPGTTAQVRIDMRDLVY